MNNPTYKLVLDVDDSGKWHIDVRKMPNGKKTIGHVVLSDTGLAWVCPNGKKECGKEILWADLAKVMKSIKA